MSAGCRRYQARQDGSTQERFFPRKARKEEEVFASRTPLRMTKYFRLKQDAGVEASGRKRRRGSGPSRHQSQPRMAVPQAIYFFGQGKPFEGQDRLAEASVQTGHQSQPRMAVPESQSLPSLGQAQDRRVASEEREAKRRVVHHRGHRDHRAEKRMADPFLGQDKCVQGSLQTGQYTSKTEKISTVGRRGSRNSGGWDLK